MQWLRKTFLPKAFSGHPDFHSEIYANVSRTNEMEQTIPAQPLISRASTSIDAIPVGLRSRNSTSTQLARGEIWTAVFRSDTTAIQRKLDEGEISNIYAVDSKLGTPLQAAAQGGSPEAVKKFLKLKANPNIYGGRLHSALQAGAYSTKLDVLKLLLAADSNVNAISSIARSPLHAAVERGSPEMIKLLIRADASVHAEGGIYGYPLQITAFRGIIDVVNLLWIKVLMSMQRVENTAQHFMRLPWRATLKRPDNFYREMRM